MRFMDTNQQTLMEFSDMMDLTYYVGPLDTALIFKDKGYEIGYVVYNYYEGKIEKFEIFENHRGQGYSHYMMDLLLHRLKDEIKVVELMPTTDKLFGFYSAFGFKRYKRFWKRHLMWKSLS
jgi:ribosomal protein S18 acetylase RimI-like enzyme